MYHRMLISLGAVGLAAILDKTMGEEIGVPYNNFKNVLMSGATVTGLPLLVKLAQEKKLITS